RRVSGPLRRRVSNIFPAWPGDDAGVVRDVVKRIPYRRIDLLSFEWTVLRVDPYAFLIPQHHLVTAVSSKIERKVSKIRMTVIGKHHHSLKPAVDHPAVLGVTREKDKLFSIASPIHRIKFTPVLNGLRRLQDIAVPVEQKHHADIPVKVHHHVLKAGKV